MTRWFPVAPGTTLPAAPAAVGGQITATKTVPVWNETVLLSAATRSRLDVTSFNYSLSLLTTVSPLATKTGLACTYVTLVPVSTQELTIAFNTPDVLISYSGVSASVDVAVSAHAPDLVVSEGLVAPLKDVAVEFPTPGVEVITPGVMNATAAVISVSAPAPTSAGAVINGLSVVTGNAAPLLGNSPTSTYDGWTRIQNANADDEYVEFTPFGFNFYLAGTAYTSCFVSSNGYVTFGAGSTEYRRYTSSNPPYPKLFFLWGDHSYQRVYTITGTSKGVKYATFRWEGAASSSGTTPGNSDTIAEVTFTEAYENTQYIEVRLGDYGVYLEDMMVASSNTSYATAQGNGNKSIVFQGNTTGTSWSTRYFTHLE